MLMRSTLATLLLFACVACNRPRPVPTDAGTDARTYAPEAMRQNFEASDVVFIGQPLEIVGGPVGWSGSFATFQDVRYRLLRNLKGVVAAEGETVTIAHPLLNFAPTVDAKEPRLDTTFFGPSRRLIVFAQRRDGMVECLNASDGVVPATDEILRLLEKP